MNRRYCISCASSSCLLLTCLAGCAGSTASSPCTRPPSPPSQVGSCAPAESPFSTQDDCPYSEGDTWTDKTVGIGSRLDDGVRLCAFLFVFYLVNSKTSSTRNSSTGKVKPGMWIIGHLSVDGAENFPVNPNARRFRPARFRLALGGQRTEILGELLRVERGAHQDDLEVVSDVQQILHDGEQNVRLQVSLVDLVQHQVAHAGQQSAAQTTTKRKVSSRVKFFVM